MNFIGNEWICRCLRGYVCMFLMMKMLLFHHFYLGVKVHLHSCIFYECSRLKICNSYRMKAFAQCLLSLLSQGCEQETLAHNKNPRAISLKIYVSERKENCVYCNAIKINK